MSVVLPSLVTDDAFATATNFTESPTISNPQLTTTNTNFVATTAQVKTEIPTPSSATEMVTNVAQTFTGVGTISFNGTNAINNIDNTGTIAVGNVSNVVSIGVSNLNTFNINNTSQWNINFPRFCVTNSVTTGGTAGCKVGKIFRSGSATVTGTSLIVSISATIFANPPTVILTPYSTSITPLSYVTYWVTAVTATSFTINCSTAGRTFYYILLGS